MPSTLLQRDRDPLGWREELQWALAQPPLAAFGGGSIDPAAREAAYRVASCLGHCRLFAAEPGTLDGTLPAELAAAAAEQWVYHLDEWRKDAGRLELVWADAAEEVEALDFAADLLTARTEAWAVFLAVDEAYRSTPEAAGPANARLREAIASALDSLDQFDAALRENEVYLAPVAGTRLLENWRTLLAPEYGAALPWWLDDTLERLHRDIWKEPARWAAVFPGPPRLPISEQKGPVGELSDTREEPHTPAEPSSRLFPKRREWLYRAAASAADWEATVESLTSHDFLFRSAYAGGGQQLVANVRSVAVGDIVHVAFASGDGLEGIGSFEILPPSHPDAEAPVVDDRHVQLALFQVRAGSPLGKMLAGTTYPHDPKLERYVGWHVREVETRDIRFTRDMFPGHNALHLHDPGIAGEVGGDFSTPPIEMSTVLASGAAFRSLGVDWSGSAKAGSKVWSAVIDFEPDGCGRLESVTRPFPPALAAAGVASAFAGWLGSQRFEVAGLDFCFGLSRGHVVPGLPRSGPTALGQWVAGRYADPTAFKTAFGAEQRRVTDRDRRAPFAPTNLRMFRQTYWGLRALAGLTLPILPWGVPGDRVVVEVLPAHIAAAACPDCHYKGRSAPARQDRERLLRAVARSHRLTIADDLAATVLADHEGDAMDAVLAAVAAGAARAGGFAGVPADAASSGEGWIYSV